MENPDDMLSGASSTVSKSQKRLKAKNNLGSDSFINVVNQGFEEETEENKQTIHFNPQITTEERFVTQTDQFK